jgi:bifunctional DNA-binding transcriptional regulator/antitoxin component of YhaV-PrlF toxin-antitoxin module
MAAGRRETRLSSRNQVTLPAEIVRQYGFAPGPRFFVEDFGDAILLVPDRPEEDEELPIGAYGRTEEEIAAYIARERASWNDPDGGR